MSTLDEWTAAVCADLGVARPDAKAILDLAREVAHAVDRPAAPLTAYLVGVAVGQGSDVRDAMRKVTRLAAGWPGEDPAGR
jgi:uncharacterized protein DUF6457